MRNCVSSSTQIDPHHLAPAVPGCVGQALLDDAIDDVLQDGRQASELNATVKYDV